MRMHKKSNLEERLKACSSILTVCDLSDKNMKRASLVRDYIDREKIFPNGNPIHLEIGCGKGKFVLEMAKKNPQINYVACEKISNVLIEALESCLEQGIENVHFLNSAAEVLERYFPENSVERIYLNFSNPLPKDGYKKQRLTHPRFLKIYEKILVGGGEIIQKTDDEMFYLFSKSSYLEEGFEILSISEDWLGDDTDIETEHEAKFKAEGKHIFRIIARK